MARRDPLGTLERKLDRALKKQVRDGLATVFTELSCKAVAREIKKGRKVTGNAEFGVRMCVHKKVGPRYNPSTKRFYPMTTKGKKLERDFVKKVNDMLETGGYKKMSPTLISKLRKGDRAFEKRVKRR